MSDETTVVDVPTNAAPAAADTTLPAAPDAGATAAPAEAPVSGEEKPVEAPKESKTFSQEDLDRIVAKEKAKERRKWEREHAQQSPPAQAAPTQQDDAPKVPLLSEYTSEDAYYKAIGEYADKVTDYKKTVEAKAQEKQKHQEYIHGVESRYEDAVDSATEKYPDFKDAFKALGSLPISDEVALDMRETIALSGKADDLLYHLGKNTEEAMRIAKLPAKARALEIGKLEAALIAKPPEKKLSAAPAPIEPVTPRGGAHVVDMSDAKSIQKLGGHSSWIEARNAEQRKALEQRHR